MTCCSHQVILDDKDIPVDDDASCQESVADVDEEAKVTDEVTEDVDPLTNHGDGDYVADAEARVEDH